MTGLTESIALPLLVLDEAWMKWVVGAWVLIFSIFFVPWILGVKWIPNNKVGIVEKLWSAGGSLADGKMISLDGEAGFQARLLRGGLHINLWPWQFRVHRVPLVTVAQGTIGYVFARDGQALEPQQTLGRVVPSNNFQDAAAFLRGGYGPEGGRGQRGRQRAILREGVYAVNLALFTVITEDTVYRQDNGDKQEADTIAKWHRELRSAGGFRPIVVGRQESGHTSEQDDNIGIVTIHDGPALPVGEIIAPQVGALANEPDFHNNFQDVEAFLRSGGYRGRQFQVLTDGTFFINRWFADVEYLPKTVVPIGHVGVVVSYYGKKGHDLSGTKFRHGELVATGERGVQQETLGPGKYAFNTYAGSVHLVPTTNFVLHWITGKSESHRFDESLKSIDLVTADAYEPVLPLSIVVHLDYEKAPSVVQRFGDVHKLITQTIDPLLSAYFRDIAHRKTMLQLLHDRHAIQTEARNELRVRFAGFDLELVDVLIGKPDMQSTKGSIETLLDQLRQRQLAREQVQTYEEQIAAADKLKSLRLSEAVAQKQVELTNSKVNVEIAKNQGDAELARARLAAEQTVVTAEAEQKRRILQAEAEARSRALTGEGEGKKIAQEGQAEADVLRQKIASFGDPKLYAIATIVSHLAESKQPLVPERLFVAAGGGDSASGGGASQGVLATLMNLLIAEKAGFEGKATEKDAEPAAHPTEAAGAAK